MELEIEFPAGLVLDIVIELIALHHFFFVLDDNIIKDTLYVLFLLVYLLRRVGLFSWLDVGFLFVLYWPVGVEKRKDLRKIFDVNSLEKCAVIILKLLFALLNEILLRISKQFSWWKFRQVILPLSFLTIFMDGPHSTVSFLKSPSLSFFRINNLHKHGLT